jgi:hypothetical protein
MKVAKIASSQTEYSEITFRGQGFVVEDATLQIKGDHDWRRVTPVVAD